MLFAQIRKKVTVLFLILVLFNLVSSAQITTEVDILTASDAAAEDWYGYSVAIDGNLVVVGSPRDDNDSGSAYVYDCSIYPCTQVVKLTTITPVAGDGFGSAVAISGNTVVVGAYGTNSNTGAAYVFDLSTCGGACTEKNKLSSSNGAEYDVFGISVALDGNTVVVGAEGEGNSSGAVYVFARSGTTWSLQAQLVPQDPAPSTAMACPEAVMDQALP